MPSLTRRGGVAIEPYGEHVTELTGLPRKEVLTGTRTELLAEIKRASRRGEIGQMTHMIHIDGYLWGVSIVRVKEAPPVWRKWAIIAGTALLSLAALCGLGLYAIHETVSGMGNVVTEHGVWMALTLMAISAVVAGALRRSLIAEITVRIFK